MYVEKMSPESWREISETSHVVCFKEVRPADMERISFALVAFEENTPLGYITCRELDSESLYIQYGGAFPTSEKSVLAWRCYEKFHRAIKEMRFKRVTTYIQNINIPMLKLAMKMGYRIIGVRFFNNEIFCELLNTLEE